MEAHGGADAWRSIESIEMRYRERWYPPFAQLGQSPWPSSSIDGWLQVWPHHGLTSFLADDHPTTIRHGPHGVWPHTRDWNAAYALPRTHFILLLPFKFLDEGARHTYIGRRKVFGEIIDDVFIEYAPGTGSSPGDRYWAHFDGTTHRLVSITLTVTAYHALALGDLHFHDWQSVPVGDSAILLPGVIRASYPGGALPLPLHRSIMSSYRVIQSPSAKSTSTRRAPM